MSDATGPRLTAEDERRLALALDDFDRTALVHVRHDAYGFLRRLWGEVLALRAERDAAREETQRVTDNAVRLLTSDCPKVEEHRRLSFDEFVQRVGCPLCLRAEAAAAEGACPEREECLALAGAPIGMYHCTHCGQMIPAGLDPTPLCPRVQPPAGEEG